MARLTRRSARLQDTTSASPSTASTATPIFSARTSVVDTPDTSDDGEALSTAKARSSRATKRKAVSEDDDEEEEDDEAMPKTPARSLKRAPKRQAVANRAYVEIPSKTSTPVKGEDKATVCIFPSHARRLVIANILQVVSKKNKGKAPVRPKATIASDGEDSALEYDETRSLDESLSSGSEFEASESSDFEAAADSNQESDDDEELMLNVAVANSLATPRSNGASSSTAPLLSPAAQRAAAAERRLTRANKDVDVDDSMMIMDVDDESSMSDSEDEPLSKKSKGKGKAKAKAKAVASTSTPKIMTFADQRKRRRELAKERSEHRKSTRKEEAELRKKLGRKLTHVGRSSYVQQTTKISHPGREDNDTTSQAPRGASGCLG